MAELVSMRYATALFDLGLETQTLSDIFVEVETILSIFESDEEIMKIINHPQITSAEKMSVLDKAFGGKVSGSVMGLFALVLKKNREADLLSILRAFIQKVREHKGITVATLYSASVLSNEQIASIKSSLSAQLKKQVEINASVDPSLLGGLCIRVDGQIFDRTIKKQLDDMKKHLLGIQIV